MKNGYGVTIEFKPSDEDPSKDSCTIRRANFTWLANFTGHNAELRGWQYMKQLVDDKLDTLHYDHRDIIHDKD